MQKQWEEKNGDGKKRGAVGGELGFIAGQGGVRCDAAVWGRFCRRAPGLLEYFIPTETSSGFASGLGDSESKTVNWYRVKNDLLVLIGVGLFSDRNNLVL